ncbi:MAG: LysR family transcriptional regulator [Flavobacteriaceae bacterium]|nr:LysR family transcriptional regulator [Flavobacteriaceae bacterium]
MGHKKTRTKEPEPGFHGRVWLEGEEGTFIGFGRAILLEKIRDLGSIAKATKEMRMSYKHGWSLVKSMERQAGSPVVVTSRGGKNGGGATITSTGEQLLTWFWRVQEKLETLLAEETALWLKEKKENAPS